MSDEWQPIETAPKDGTRVQLLSIKRPQFESLPGILWIKIGKWCAHYQDGYTDGWREDAIAAPNFPMAKLVPTHWMVLPEPPDNLTVGLPKDQKTL